MLMVLGGAFLKSPTLSGKIPAFTVQKPAKIMHRSISYTSFRCRTDTDRCGRLFSGRLRVLWRERLLRLRTARQPSPSLFFAECCASDPSSNSERPGAARDSVLQPRPLQEHSRFRLLHRPTARDAELAPLPARRCVA